MTTHVCALCRRAPVSVANKLCPDCGRLAADFWGFVNRATGLPVGLPRYNLRLESSAGLRLGRLPSQAANIARRVPLRAFFDLSKLPALPASYPPPSNYRTPMYLNDQLGICGPAACAHAVGQNSLISNGTEVLFTDDQMRAFYFGITGGQDSGVDMEQMFGYWLRTPLGAEPLLGYAALTPGDLDQLEAAQFVFEGAVIVGFSLPDRVVPSGGDWLAIPWTGTSGAPNPYNGHAVSLPGYRARGGPYFTVTWADDRDRLDGPFYGRYGDSPFVAFTRSILNQATQRSAGGLDVAGLLQAIHDVTGRDPTTPPDNPPPPPPDPNRPTCGQRLDQALKGLAAASLWPSGVRI